ncbi:MAG: hypothetical protein WB760_20800 [Xanthobacteraceae bacterium]
MSDNLRVAPLFDADRFPRHLQEAYSIMVDIQRRGESARSLTIRHSSVDR